VLTDKNTLTADPNDSNFVYAVLEKSTQGSEARS
jgi:hypothetical protein